MEEWKVILEADSCYLISNFGRIKSLSREIKIRYKHKGFTKEKILCFGKDKSGYNRIPLISNGKRITFKVHRLVAKAFVPNPNNKPFVNHINGIKTDNRVENLEWCTAKENINHAIKIGLKNPSLGEENGLSKLTEKEVRYILSIENKTHKEISLMYNVSRSTISYIIRRKTWKHIDIK